MLRCRMFTRTGGPLHCRMFALTCTHPLDGTLQAVHVARMLDATLYVHLPPHRVDALLRAVQISFALELMLHATLQNVRLHLHLHLLAHSAN